MTIALADLSFNELIEYCNYAQFRRDMAKKKLEDLDVEVRTANTVTNVLHRLHGGSTAYWCRTCKIYRYTTHVMPKKVQNCQICLPGSKGN